jgi:hypothetical protein
VYSFEYNGYLASFYDKFSLYKKNGSTSNNHQCILQKRYINSRSAIDDLGDDEALADVVIIPPSPDYYQTDNDEIDVDRIQENVLPPYVPGGIEVFASHEDGNSEDEIPLAALYRHNYNQPKPKKQKPKNSEPEPKWTIRTIDIGMNGTNGFLDRENNLEIVLKKLNPVEIFRNLFDDKIKKNSVAESKRYALQKNDHTTNKNFHSYFTL